MTEEGRKHKNVPGMEIIMNDYKREAGLQYLRYFRFWFIGVATVIALTVVMGIVPQGLGMHDKLSKL